MPCSLANQQHLERARFVPIRFLWIESSSPLIGWRWLRSYGFGLVFVTCGGASRVRDAEKAEAPQPTRRTVSSDRSDANDRNSVEAEIRPRRLGCLGWAQSRRRRSRVGKWPEVDRRLSARCQRNGRSFMRAFRPRTTPSTAICPSPVQRVMTVKSISDNSGGTC